MLRKRIERIAEALDAFDQKALKRFSSRRWMRHYTRGKFGRNFNRRLTAITNLTIRNPALLNMMIARGYLPERKDQS